MQVKTDGKALEGTFELPGNFVDAYVIAQLEAAAKGKVVAFGPEDKGGDEPRALLFDGKVLGEWSSYDHIDLVAGLTKVAKEAGNCGSYKNTKTGEVVTIHKEARNHVYSVYDRRTGKLVKKREFRARPPACPTKIDPKEGVFSEADPADGLAFLKSLVD
jgi:hypothetical protein